MKKCRVGKRKGVERRKRRGRGKRRGRKGVHEKKKGMIF